MSHVFFREARRCSLQSTCLKAQTGAVVVQNGAVIACGWNCCAPNNIAYGERPNSCPRMETATGSDYALCGPIHAEVMACLNIRPNRDLEELAHFASHRDDAITDEKILEAFTEEELEALNGATLYLVGHYWACDACLRFAHLVGIDTIEFDPITSDETYKRYKKQETT